MTTSMNCLGCGATTPSSPCEACLDAQAALESYFRSKAPTRHLTAEVTRLTAEVERLTSLLATYGNHKVSCAQRYSCIYACACGWNEVRP